MTRHELNIVFPTSDNPGADRDMVSSALKYFNEQIYKVGNNHIHLEDIPLWLRNAARIRTALIPIKSWLVAPGEDILR